MKARKENEMKCFMNKINDMKWYMNNPCKIIRVINDNFVEIEVYPEFADDISGSDWCCACMAVAGSGAYPSHTCEPYQDVIDKINETDTAMLVVVESRLLQDHPVEFKPMIALRSKANDLLKQSEQLRNDIYEQRKLLDSMRGELKDLIMQQSIVGLNIASSKYDEMLIDRKVDRLKSKRFELKQEIKEYKEYLALKKKFEGE